VDFAHVGYIALDRLSWNDPKAFLSLFVHITAFDVFLLTLIHNIFSGGIPCCCCSNDKFWLFDFT